MTGVGSITAATLGGIGLLHVLWGRGSNFPFGDRHDLNDRVIGQQVSPTPGACNAVAGLLATAALSVAIAPRSRLAGVGSAGCGVVLGVRAALGFAGRTDLAVPGSTSSAFCRNDRRIYAPLCAALSLGAISAASRRASAVPHATVNKGRHRIA